MNEPTNETTGQFGGNHAEETTAKANTAEHPLNRLFSAMDKGAQDARKAAEHALPRIKAAVNQADYWAGYGLSFAATFSWTLARVLTPESMKSGARDGLQCGKDAAERVIEKIKMSRVIIFTINRKWPAPSVLYK